MVKENKCKTPGRRIKSNGQGQGLARGTGRGPMGIPLYKKRSRARGVQEYADVLQYEEW